MTNQAPADDIFLLLNSPQIRVDPYPTYARFREDHRVFDTGFGVWFVFGYEECNRLLRDRNMSVDERKATFAGPGDELPTLIHIDPPDHDRLRRLVQMAFTPKRVEALRQRAEQLVEECLSRLSSGDEVDIIAELAYPMPLTIICELLGIEESRRDQVRHWSTWLARSIDPGPLRSPEVIERITAAQAEFVAEMRRLIAHRRLTPGNDLLSQLVTLEADGDHLDESELIGLAVLLLVAGHETTVSLIGNGLCALADDRDQFEIARHDVSNERAMIDEVLRFDSPVQMTTRIVVTPIELAGHTIPTGSIMVLMLGAANRDPSVFTHPEQLDISQARTSPHLSFGSGIHHCLGAALARAEGEAAIFGLIRRFPNLAVIGEPPLRKTFVLRGREQLIVRL